MSTLAEPLKKGLVKSLQILLLLIKIVIPVSCLVAVLDYLGIIESIAHFFTPAMSLFGLPGEASIALLLGFFVNFYAAFGVIATFTPEPHQITILAVMIGICHELPIESVICSYTGLRIPVSVALRVLTAIVAGILLNLVYSLVVGG